MLVSSIASITAKGSEEKNNCNDQLFADMDRIQWITWACTCVKSEENLVKTGRAMTDYSNEDDSNNRNDVIMLTMLMVMMMMMISKLFLCSCLKVVTSNLLLIPLLKFPLQFTILLCEWRSMQPSFILLTGLQSWYVVFILIGWSLENIGEPGPKSCIGKHGYTKWQWGHNRGHRWSSMSCWISAEDICAA